MSTLAAWSYTNTATIFPLAGLDEWSQPTYGAPYLIACTWKDTGSTQMDSNGNEFVPESTYWFESEYPAKTTTSSAYALSDGDGYLTSNGEQYLTVIHAEYTLSDSESYTTTDGEEYEVIGYNSGTTTTTVIPKRGDIIMKFDNRTELEPLKNGGQIIRKVTSYDMTPFGNEIPDWEIFT